MTRSNFLEKMSKMTHDDILLFIKDKGKHKEQVCYNCPWYIKIISDEDDENDYSESQTGYIH